MKARGCTENKPVSDRNRQESDQGSRQERPLARDVGWRGGLRTKSDAHDTWTSPVNFAACYPDRCNTMLQPFDHKVGMAVSAAGFDGARAGLLGNRIAGECKRYVACPVIPIRWMPTAG